MNELIRQCGIYLKETLGILPSFHGWVGQPSLPLFLKERYSCFQGEILGVSCIFLAAIGNEPETPATVRKHLDLVGEKSNQVVVYVHPIISSWNRKRLVEHQIPFIVPGNQLYLPPLGIDFREHFYRRPATVVEKFFPATQQVLLYLLHKKNFIPLTAREIAGKLGYSTMTIGRVFNELHAADIKVVKKSGRSSLLMPVADRRALWERVMPFLSSPVISRVILHPADLDRPYWIAGESALALQSGLAAPYQETLAISKDQWREMKVARVMMELEVKEPGSVVLEIWQYSPKLFARDDAVDTLSLYLSFRETSNERICAALDEMLKDFAW